MPDGNSLSSEISETPPSSPLDSNWRRESTLNKSSALEDLKNRALGRKEGKYILEAEQVKANLKAMDQLLSPDSEKIVEGIKALVSQSKQVYSPEQAEEYALNLATIVLKANTKRETAAVQNVGPIHSKIEKAPTWSTEQTGNFLKAFTEAGLFSGTQPIEPLSQVIPPGPIGK